MTMVNPNVANMHSCSAPIDFRTAPDRYRHWRIEVEGNVARLILNVDPAAILGEGYELKLNSYDLGVDIELYDAIQRLRFEYPTVAAVVITSANERVFCAGANIKMLGRSSHAHKVNFCKFTNETRNSIEDATQYSGQTYLCAVNGPCAGGGYELALACDRILMVDDGATTVALPEVPLLGVLPGTGGLTRLVDKRHVRPDRADVFSTLEEGIRGDRAVAWGLVDEVVPVSRFHDVVMSRAREAAARSDRPRDASGVAFTPLVRTVTDTEITYQWVAVEIDRTVGCATINIRTPDEEPLTDLAAIVSAGADYWPLALARQLDDAILHLRANEDAIGTWVFRSTGSHGYVLATDEALWSNRSHWLVREIGLYLKRVLKRIDVSSRTVFAEISPGSCFSGTLLEIVLAADQSFMLDGEYEGNPEPCAAICLSALNFGHYPMVNGLTRLERRFPVDPSQVQKLRDSIGIRFDARAAEAAGLVTFAPDDLDWDDEIRLALESRASYSPDALTAMEANLRFGGPETLESKIFARLSAWQNWIFQRPNAVGEKGALVCYGSGVRPEFNKQRV